MLTRKYERHACSENTLSALLLPASNIPATHLLSRIVDNPAAHADDASPPVSSPILLLLRFRLRFCCLVARVDGVIKLKGVSFSNPLRSKILVFKDFNLKVQEGKGIKKIKGSILEFLDFTRRMLWY
ncbi:hypothetical protein L1887_18425 [Cichorium endivia]|nr:hypothetical protein L1887_18425 [Cichorium endivia]